MSPGQREPEPLQNGEPAPLSDGALIVEARQGVARAWSQLETRYRSKIYALSCSILRDREEALDATQEALIRIYQSMESFDDSRPAAPWLMRVALNVARDRLRGRERLLHQHSTSLDDRCAEEDGVEPGVAARISSPEAGPEESVIKGDLADTIVRCVEQLHPRDQLAIWARYYWEITLEDLAPMLGVTTRGAKHVADQAVVRLAALLAARGITVETVREN